MRRVSWFCDRCGEEYNKIGETQVEDPTSYVVRGTVLRTDLCEPCSAKLERFLAGAELERKPDDFVGSVKGEASANE